MPERYEMPYNMDLFVRLRDKHKEARREIMKVMESIRKHFKGKEIDLIALKKIDLDAFMDWRTAIFREEALAQIVLNGYFESDELFDTLHDSYNFIRRPDVIRFVTDLKHEIESEYRLNFGGKTKKEAKEFPTYLGAVLDFQKDYGMLSDGLSEYAILKRENADEEVSGVQETIFGKGRDSKTALYRKIAISQALLEGYLDVNKVREAISREEDSKEIDENKIQEVINEIHKEQIAYQYKEQMGKAIDQMGLELNNKRAEKNKEQES